MTTTTIGAVPTTPRVPAALWYAGHTARIMIKNWPYLIFTVGLPMIMYLTFSGIWGGDEVAPGIDYGTVIMVQMAGYGALGAAMTGGSVIALERRSGWFRQLSITALSPRGFLLARTGTVLALVLPSILLVFGCGFVIRGVRAPAADWLGSLLLMWFALVPLAALGLVIGVLVKAEAVQGVTTLTLLMMSLAGGLWFPAEMMPDQMQTVAHLLPSYWIAGFGRWPFVGGAFPTQGVLVDVVWTLALVVVGAVGYRRAAADSKR